MIIPSKNHLSLALATFLLFCTLCSLKVESIPSFEDFQKDRPPLILTKESPVISPALSRFISGCPPQDSIDIWILFTDKGIFSQELYQQTKNTFRNSITNSTLKRRLKNKVRVDFLDLPVNQKYIDQILRLNGKLRQRSRWLNAASFEVQVKAIEKVAQLPFVRQIKKVASFKRGLPEISPDLGKLHPLKASAGYGRNYGPSLDQLVQINVPIVHDMGFKGENVIVGMLDTGYRKDHQAFSSAYSESRILAEWDFINDDGNTQNQGDDPLDQHNHGTHIWSTLGGEYEGELYGPAYKASFVLAKTEDVSQEIQTEEDDWVAGLEWADSVGAEVISSSVGYTDWYTYSDLDGNTALCTQAADIAASRGIVVANAAGNERNKVWHYVVTPADGDSVMAVGAVSATGEIASFSSVGPTYDGRTKPEVVARGVATYCASASGPGDYANIDGTSLSTPLVAGCAAVLLFAHPDWTAMQVREALMLTADNAFSPDTVYGWGLMDLFAASNYNPMGALTIQHHPSLFTSDTLNPYLMSATIIPGNGLNQDSLFLFWRSDTLSPFVKQKLQSLGSDQYKGEIPAQGGGTVLHYYFSAQDSLGYVVNLPLGAPRFKFKYYVNTDFISFDFEDGLFHWETGGDGNLWNMTSSYTHDGTFGLTDSPRGYYHNNANSWVGIEETFDLSDAVNPQFSFWHRYQFGEGDSGFVEINTDGGKSWQKFSSGFAGDQSEWTYASLPLDPYSGRSDVKFRFHLICDDADTAEGWYIDDVRINFKPTSVEEEPVSIPYQFSLDQNYPNPFNPTTNIRFTVHGSQFTVHSPIHTSLKIYNVMGQMVRTLLDEEMMPGEYQVIWDGEDHRGKEVSSGIYFYQLVAGDKKITKKMVLLK